MSLTSKQTVSKIAWILIAGYCVFYAPMAFEYFFHFFNSDAPYLWLKFFTKVVGEQHTLGAGSAEVVQHKIYAQNRVPMLFHTMMGGTAILLASIQFYAPFRKKHPNIHQNIGKLFSVIVVVSMIGSITFLINAGPKNTFNGLPFYLQLWLLAIGTLGSLILGIIAIVKKQRKIHQVAMIYCFALLLSAPVLRAEWLIIGSMFEGVTQETSNLFSSLIFGYLVVPCAILATRLTDQRKPVLKQKFKVMKLPDITIVLSGAIAFILIILKYQSNIESITNYAICVFVLFCVTLFVYLQFYKSSLRAGNEITIKEWRIHFLAYCISPIVFLIFWEIICSFANSYDAFIVASFTAPALVFSLGYLLMAITRKNKKLEHTY
ncbi:hypothetical protein MWMV2_MWMV2_00617 [Acinetobacter oleivorans]|nr:hypothetical protein MWMV5_MWMV5_00509 [Acinetobacter oleivorans]CAI3108273.1 hypothetical protein MWMV13_MWMV13_00509 [Acinetobacter oleivorans]CAI3110236.1 hypothetical protein MWMV3_MWMV3_00617 [Acinetobacter oleivorans]CAI3110300.1 hypothetical protein MWMV12_MWMV12_00617 [Acinetobacter oleivorans]CAI3110339.1 hypothetical protein MWMV19_MWMV19_00617 [Acinetobacter oleivorans]